MKICWFGIYKPDFSRNRVYMEGLRRSGHEIIECRDESRGMLKFWRLYVKHRKILKMGGYDALVVGYPGHLVVPLAKLLVLTNRWKTGHCTPVIADLLGSLADAEKHSHGAGWLRVLKLRMIDLLAVMFADIVLLESHAQMKYFSHEFGNLHKYRVVYTGVDEGVFSHVGSLLADGTEGNRFQTGGIFTVFFRGKLTPECGIGHILKAAEILKNDHNICFKIIGKGYLLPFTERMIAEKGLRNVTLESRYLSDQEMRTTVRKASLYLGQFEQNHRLKRTIPHKAFEAFAAGIPYLSAEAPAIQELVTEGETGFLVPMEDAGLIAEKIRVLSRQPDLLARVSRNARNMYEERLTSVRLASEIIKAASCRNKQS